MVNKICTHCGYEGQAVKRPAEGPDETSETKAAFDKLCRVITVATFIPVKPIAMALVAPIYLFIIWPIKLAFGEDGRKWCPNCGLPLMVSLKSDAGWLAKRKNDIKAGAVRVGREEGAKLAFGKEIKLPGDEEPEQATAPTPVPEKLPSLDAMLEPEIDSEPAAVEDKKQQPVPAKPKPKPDEW